MLDSENVPSVLDVEFAFFPRDAVGIILFHLAVAQHGGNFAGLRIVLSDQVISLIRDVNIVRIIHANVLGCTERSLFARTILFAAFASADDCVDFPIRPYNSQSMTTAFEHVDIAF